MSQWEDLASRQPYDETANFDIKVLGEFKRDRLTGNSPPDRTNPKSINS